MTSPARRTLVALATAAALLPAAPALAQTATPTPSATPSPTTSPTPAPVVLTDLTASAGVIDFGDTVDVTVRGTAGATVDLLIGNARLPQFRVIRTATISANGTFTWTGLRPEDTTQFLARLAGTDPLQDGPGVDVRVRRDVTIGVSQANGIHTFSGQLQRAEAGVQVTIAQVDPNTQRVTGVASTSTQADGSYTVHTRLPAGFAAYYALTEAKNGLDAGRSRLYGLIVNTRPATAPPPSLTLGVVRLNQAAHLFQGTLSPAREGVPVTLARIVNGRLVGVVGGTTSSTGKYTLTTSLAPGTYQFTVLTANARSRNYGLVVPAAPVSTPVVQPQPAGGQPADVDR